MSNDDNSPEIVAGVRDSMERIDKEIADALTVCIEAGFQSSGDPAAVGADPIERLRWNFAYSEALQVWVGSDPDWQTIGIGPRLAVELIAAGVYIQIAAAGIGDMPNAGAVALHNYSVVYGAWRSELNRWRRGQYGGEGREAFAAANAEAAPLQAEADAARGDARQAMARVGASGGQASGESRRWWWVYAWERWKARRAVAPDEKKKAVAKLLLEEMERAFPKGVGPRKGQTLPKDLTGYVKVIAKFEAGWRPPGMA